MVILTPVIGGLGTDITQVMAITQVIPLPQKVTERFETGRFQRRSRLLMAGWEMSIMRAARV